ncbi:hypothetical protein [Thalassotalea mangrovi]|uniref:Uncharacterized protein n=1 Tax=Thalassotalea mangrovi TaxID=2572245 RepID=A0A4U1B4C1_9GAMM|nr:hypothetical protein [Thalassotalea mangrovi]TKB44916.1 hypothetical protein E8M12_10455 [Thalassotalea mangrovi]
MTKAENELLIENENLFRSLVCAPVAVLFVLLAANAIMTSSIVIFQVIFVLLAIYFTLSTLAYASFYTNERYQGEAKPFFKNRHLSKALTCFLLTIVFGSVAINTVTSSAHIVFKGVSIVLALYFTLSTLAFAAYFTNDVCDTADH